MNWRSSAEREVRARVSPEMLAGALVIVLIVAILGILSVAQSGGTEPTPEGSTAEPTAFADRDPTPAADPTSMGLLVRLSDLEPAGMRTGEPCRRQERCVVAIRRNDSSALAMPSFRLTAGL